MIYSTTLIDDRLLGTVAAIDGGGTNGNMRLLAGTAVACTFQLSVPSGTVAGGVLTFGGTLLDPAAVGNVHPITAARIEDSTGSIVVSGLTAGVAAGNDIILSSSVIAAGQSVGLLSAQIVGA
jgi:hypothetical protein